MALSCSLATGQEEDQPEPETRGAISVSQPATSIQSQQQQSVPRLSGQESLAIQQSLSPTQRRTVTDLARRIAAGAPFSTYNEKWTGLVRSVATSSPGFDVDLLSRHVVGQSQALLTGNIQSHAEKLHALMEAIAQVQQELKQATDELKALHSHLQEARSDQQRAEITAKIEIKQAEIRALEGKLENLRDQSEMARFKLQELQQQQARLYNMFSNIMKTLHDTAKAMVQNMR